MRSWLAILLGVGVLPFASLSCGDDGNGCTGSACNLKGTTTVKWTFNHYPEWKFDDDSCNEIGAETVRVVAKPTDDPNNPDAVVTQEAKCNDKQVVLLGLDPGTFDVTVTPIDVNGFTLVKEPATGTVPSGTAGKNTEVTINVPYTAWQRAYTGTFLFQLKWGGQPCTTATPPVTTQVLTMMIGGQPVTKPTHAGQRVDGTDPQPCATTFDYIELLPFGPATFAIVGKDAGGVVRFQQQYDSFVGVGTFNPTINYDLPLPDAGVPDAPPDAPPDAT
ncbi:MAG: hypothetical protein NT062_14915 [Proteobacteria bacterium]|nr:hypothetical protein [Pseudomonadota bacterium]